MKRSNPDYGLLLCIFFLVLGIVLRLKQFLLNCSLDIDEARIAVDLLARSFLNIILHQLPYSDLPTPPIGLLLLEKGAISLLGPQEWALRFIPFLCSILALVLFFRLVRLAIQPAFQWFALVLFSLNQSLIIYAASVKQYSSDALIAVVMILFFKKVCGKVPGFKEIIYYGALGFIVMFFSYTAVFMLAGIAGALIIPNLKNRKLLVPYGGMALIWMGGFILYYFSYYYSMAHNPAILESAQPWFLPRPLFSLESFLWSASSFMALFSNPLGLFPECLAVILFLVGSAHLFRKDRPVFCVLIFPLLAVFLAASLRKYPFFERYLIFLLPSLILILTEGMDAVNRVSFRFKPALLGCLFFILLSSPGVQAFVDFTRTHCPRSYREVMAYLKNNVRPDDLVYLNSSSQFPYWYYGYTLGVNKSFSKQPMGTWNNQLLYKHRVGRIFDQMNRDEAGTPFVYIRYEMFAYNKDGVVRTKDYADYYAQKVYRLYTDSPFPSRRRQRVWVLFLYAPDELNKHVVRYFRNKGKQTDGIKRNGSALYLFEVQ